MTKPLIVIFLAAAALRASAQAPKPAAEAKAELTKAFAKGDDVNALDLTGQPPALAEMREQARYVQQGRESSDTLETYVAFIRSVARRLGAKPEEAVALYRDRARARRAVQAGKAELEARDALALDVKRNPGISAAKKKRVERDLLDGSKYLRLGLDSDAGAIPAASTTRPVELNISYPAAPPSAADSAAYDQNGVRNWTRLPPRVQPYPNAMNPTPSPAPLQSASAGIMSWAAASAYFDWEKGKQVAMEAYTGTLNYVKKMGAMCYRFFKQALIDAGVLDVPDPSSTGLIGLRPGAARMFSQDVKKNPKILDGMGYRQVDLAKASNDPATVPDGSLLIYAAGCSFADPQHGHAEITVGEATYASLRAQNSRLRSLPVEANEIRVCHFSCTTRTMPFLRTYGKQGCLKMYVPVKPS